MLDGPGLVITVKWVLQGPPSSIVGLLQAACDANSGDELADALHPMLRTWVHQGGEDPLWQDAVEYLRGGVIQHAGTLCGLHFDVAAAKLQEVTQSESVAWVRGVESDRRPEALARHLQTFGGTPDDDTTQLIAHALDGQIPGLLPAVAAQTSGRFLNPASFSRVLECRAVSVIDVPAATMLHGHDLTTHRDLLDAVRHGRITLSAGGASMLSPEEELANTWMLMLAAGVRRHVQWRPEWTWRELATACIWARDAKELIQLATLAERASQRVLHPRLSRTGVHDRGLVQEAARALDAPDRAQVRHILLRLLPTELVCHWAALDVADGGVTDTELTLWARDGVGQNRAQDNALVALNHTRISERVATVLLENVRGIAESALWGGSEEVGYVVGRYLAPRIDDRAAWSLLLALSRGFQGTMSELVDAVGALSGANR